MNAKNRNQILLAVAASAAVVVSSLSPALARPSSDESLPVNAASANLDAIDRRAVEAVANIAERDAMLRARGLSAAVAEAAPAKSHYLEAFELRAKELAASAVMDERSERLYIKEMQRMLALNDEVAASGESIERPDAEVLRWQAAAKAYSSVSAPDKAYKDAIERKEAALSNDLRNQPGDRSYVNFLRELQAKNELPAGGASNYLDAIERKAHS